MRIEQLQSFVEIASSKSISIAAENLYITQPSLSRSMKLLEEELGLTLFIRSFDGVRLTEDGKTLLPTVQKILGQLEMLEGQAKALHAAHQTQPQETFTLYTLQSVADCILVYALEEIHSTFPATTFKMVIPESSDSAKLPDLSQSDLFIGLNIGNTFDQAIKDSGLQMLSIFVDSFSAVVSQDHPLAKRKIVDIDELLDYKLILHHYDFSIEDFYLKIIDPKSRRKTLDILLRSNNSRVISQLLLSSEAVLITNNILAANDYLPNPQLVSVPLRNFKYHCFALCAAETPKLPTIEALLKILQRTRLKLTLGEN